MSTLPIQIDAAKLGEGYPPEAIKQLELLMECAGEVAEARAAWKAALKRRELEVVRAVDVFGLDQHRIATASGFNDSRVGQILIEAGS